jgi:UDP-N-acetylmuramyl pentapeptide phosphotransferase/UDP-N-acetylglucosamine-1-phosphate transferase
MQIMMVALPAVLAFVSAWWITRGLCSAKSVLWILAHPNDRTLHSRPTPQTGGLAIIASVVIALVAAASILVVAQPSKPLLPKGIASGSLWIVVSMLLIFVVSFIDDCKGLPAVLRLSVQAVSALIIVVGVGLTVTSMPIPGGQPIRLGWAAVPVSVLFLMWMANLYNFMDGMDGFAGGMTCIGFGFLAYLGWIAHFPIMLIIAAFVAMGALGFLVHNFPPARIFMGDAGSITVGFVAGTLMLLGVRDNAFEFWVPVMVFSPFIADATVTLMRRAIRFEKIWLAHREHYYQRLILAGWSHRRAVLAEYGVMLVCGSLAVLYHHSTGSGRLIIWGTWVVMFLSLAMFVHRLGWKKVVRASVRDHKAASGKPTQVQSAPAEDSSRATVEV